MDIHAVEQARERIGEHVILTPCTYSETLSRLCGCEIYLKLENLQLTGSFKDRGALNKLLSLTAGQREAGVIAASAGNHAQGVAHAARLLGIPATIVMPETTPLGKLRGTEELGAKIVLHGGGYDEAFDKACELQQQYGYTLVHAFDDPLIIAGQGTIGLELLEQLPDADAVVVPVGGGGLIGGIASAIKARAPGVKVIGVEAERMAAMKRSVDAGEVTPLPMANTIADGISVARVGQTTLRLVQSLVDDIVTVSEEEIAAAILTLLEREKSLAEGAGVAGFAALLHHHLLGLQGKKVVAVISGGNIDMTRLSHIIERGLELDGRLTTVRVIAPDKPASIAQLASLVASHHANIEQIGQSRTAAEVELEQTVLLLKLQTRGRAHTEEIVNAISGHGFTVCGKK
jgi:threonine dehydratase